MDMTSHFNRYLTLFTTTESYFKTSHDENEVIRYLEKKSCWNINTFEWFYCREAAVSGTLRDGGGLLLPRFNFSLQNSREVIRRGVVGDWSVGMRVCQL